MKKVLVFCTLGILASCAQKPLAPETASTKPAFFMTKPQPTSPVTLVFDESSLGPKPVNYRKSPDLKMSGSATLNPKSLKEIAKPLKKKKDLLYVFDLRQESHGLVNDKPVTWESEREWAHADLNFEEAQRRERRLLGDLRVGDRLGSTEITSIETEESMVRSAGHQYVRLPVLDHVRPTDAVVDVFIEAQRNLPANAWVHFHCRSGWGRTTLFMSLYDMLINARSMSLEDIVKRNVDLSKDQDLLFVGSSQEWQYPYQKEQVDFLREFYNYAKAHPRGEGMLWSEWVQK